MGILQYIGIVCIRAIVLKYSENAGISKKMSPHRVRHSSITAFLQATDGNLHKAKNLSRHASFDTLKIYDDNRRRDSEQLEASELLSGLVDL
ncbi:MAG TPA: hypothetical protein DDW76_36570 [Cyanobacteria bacterium UBA11369]|nr:hypothetical protein [Cyanobacteria bacterium UBA11371]HBE36872.1 hypothetical protein [Cyanobacteria bacterium UBA11368]HBE54121.1 hypothetical protein [Cyanobacteria bacterium UBA11369]